MLVLISFRDVVKKYVLICNTLVSNVKPRMCGKGDTDLSNMIQLFLDGERLKHHGVPFVLKRC